ncbi:cyclase family protein [Coleophoma crateriformis]|uniref:Cyclase family protein n=1 Tax=Coleophoma crateriformis TaxID=565419 RepID=A0A3D8R374_9HELO|nr:cyclase family protein [Coleophoma crateriformis]
MFRTLRPRSALRTIKTCERSFITFPGTEPQHLTATRILPYPSSKLYNIVADIDSYSEFLPYCIGSKVTKWSNPDQNGKRWPAEADLSVGWGGYEETFTSKNFCVPDSIVEALGGSATTTLPKSDLPNYTAIDTPGPSNTTFSSLSTRWTLRPFHYKPPPAQGDPRTDNTNEDAREQTEVHLVLDFEFKNPIYAALSKAVAPKVAGMMIEAFEKRARRLLDGPGARVSGRDPLGEHFAGNKMGL